MICLIKPFLAGATNPQPLSYDYRSPCTGRLGGIFLIFLATLFLLGCGQQIGSNEKADSVKVKALIISQVYSFQDLKGFAGGDGTTSFGQTIDRLNKLPGVFIDPNEVRKVLNTESELDTAKIARAKDTERGKEILRRISDVIYTPNSARNIEYLAEAVLTSSADGRGSILEFIENWPKELVEVNILEILANLEEFKKLFTELQDISGN